MCYCVECVVAKLKPQWTRRSTDISENTAYHIQRAWHLAGRCIECMECQRVCPVDIPLMKLNRKLTRDVAEMFDYEPGVDVEAEPLLASYTPERPRRLHNVGGGIWQISSSRKRSWPTCFPASASTRCSRRQAAGEVLRFLEVADAAAVSLDYENTNVPPKELLFPETETLFKYRLGSPEIEPAVPAADAKRVIFGIRPCDAQAFSIVDNLFRLGLRRPVLPQQAREHHAGRARLRATLRELLLPVGRRRPRERGEP